VSETAGEARVAIVTGGGRGIGRASALRLAQDGRDVVIAELGDFGAAVVPEIEALGRRALYLKTDVTSRASVEECVAAALRAFGRLDILVNCAGVLGQEIDFLEMSEEEWFRVIDINLHGVWRCCRAVLPIMVDRGWGRIVTITSGARNGVPQLAQYATSKGGVTGLMASIARAYTGRGVLANCVQPGRALTDMVVPRFSKEFLAHPPGVPIGRYSSADEVAVVVKYLCADENTYTSGAIWSVSGGAG